MKNTAQDIIGVTTDSKAAIRATATWDFLSELRPNEANKAFLTGVQSARDMLKNIQRTVEIQVDEDGDFNIAAIAGLIHAYLPEPGPGSKEAAGFSVVLAEYLASCADGMMLDCDFEPTGLGAFLGTDESGVTK
ncbi:MAG: hypothetical protein ABIG70_04880 [Pseudomonadota bacterium]